MQAPREKAIDYVGEPCGEQEHNRPAITLMQNIGGDKGSENQPGQREQVR